VTYASVHTIRTLLDCGASHCFVDPSLIAHFNLPLVLLPKPIPLTLFDGSNAPFITHSVDITINFPCWTTLTICFLVTKLDPSALLVLGLSWLWQYNPLIDWSSNHIQFQHSTAVGPSNSLPLQDLLRNTLAPPSALAPPNKTPPDQASLCAAVAHIDVCFLNAAAYTCALRQSHYSSILHFHEAASIADTRLHAMSASKEQHQEKWRVLAGAS
jgi:hypothetical protein